MQRQGGEEYIEVGPIPVQSGLPVAGDSLPIGCRDRHAQVGQRTEHRACPCGGHGQVHIDVRRGPRVAIPSEGDGPPELVRHPKRLEQLVHGHNALGETSQRCRAGRRPRITHW